MDDNQKNGAAFATAFLNVVTASLSLSVEFSELWLHSEAYLRSLWNGITETVKGKEVNVTIAKAMEFFAVTDPKVAHCLIIATQGMSLLDDGMRFSDAELALATHRLYTNGGSLMVLEDLTRAGRVWVEQGRKGKCPTRPHMLGGKEVNLTAITTRDAYVARVEQMLKIARAELRFLSQFQQEQDALAQYEQDKAKALATGAPLPKPPKPMVKAAPVDNDDATVHKVHESLFKRLKHNGTLKQETLEALIGFLIMCRNTTVEATANTTIPAIITDDLMVEA